MEQELNIYEKLSIVKSEIGALRKNSNSHYSSYLNLNDILSALEPLLEQNGLLLLQAIEDGKVTTTIHNLTNTDEVVSSDMPLPNIVDPQKLGSAITYFRRYTLQSLLALQAVDDDGQTAQDAIKDQLPTCDKGTYDKYIKWIKAKQLDANNVLITPKYLRERFTLTPAQESALLLLKLEQ